MSTIRVVIADDHAVVRNGIAEALKGLPNLEIVGEAGDGRALFSVLHQISPDLLLLDISMPGFDPIPGVQRIRSEFPDLVILVVSAYDDDAYVRGILSAGVQGYHLKDQPLADLLLAVERVLAGERWVCGRLVSKLLQTNGVSMPALTTRQRELLRCLHEGLDNRSIALRMDLSLKTVENHLTHLYRQLRVASRLEAVKYLSEHPEALAGLEQGYVANDVGSADGAEPSLGVLIVDDNARFRKHLRQMMADAAYAGRVYDAPDSQTALALLDEKKPQLALVDVVLGEENGIDCVKRIRESSVSTRVILMSAYPDRAYHRLGLEAGAVAFVDKKDLNSAALGEMIHDIFQVARE